MNDANALRPLLAKLQRLSTLDERGQEAVLGLPVTLRRVENGGYVLREGEISRNSSILVSGFACKHKVTATGLRQILSFNMRGDWLDLQQAVLPMADHSIQTLTRADVAVVPKEAVAELVDKHPDVARALWVHTLVDSSVQREWTANVGRRDSRTRIAHILCELGVRMEACGLGSRTHYDLPFTQEQLADAAGLTSVHVNRVLQSLRASGLVYGKSPLQISDWNKMTEAADFSIAYLQPLAASHPNGGRRSDLS